MQAVSEVSELERLPEPSGLPFLGHLHRVRRIGLVRLLLDAAREVPGGIFKLRLGSRFAVFVTDAGLVAELSDETRFRKVLGPGLRVVRRFAGDGLFTSFSEEPNWSKAHRILLPAFSQRAMRGYYGVIRDVCDQLVGKWEGLSGSEVDVAADMTRLTLDSIAVAGFGHTFRSFGREEIDPFLVALERALTEARATAIRLPIQKRFAARAQRQFQADIDTMNAMVDAIIAERRFQPTDSRDLLNLMLTAVDPETGERLDDVNIRYQVLTFLIAGHETTSGLLTFVFHLLLRHPHVLAQAYAEVDRVLPGDVRPEYEDLARLTVIDRVIKEAQRLWPTAPAIGVGPYADEVIGGRWRIPKDRQVSIFIPGLHRDPNVWDRPDEFDIGRWLPEAEAAHHPHAYKPFGTGARACIGRQFALVEAKLAIAMVLRRFALSDPRNYRLTIKETLTIKPDRFTMRIALRQPHERLAAGAIHAADAGPADAGAAKIVAGAGQRMAVLYGSSLGTARDIAEEIADRARSDGFEAAAQPLDGGWEADQVSERILVVVTATYNGRAPDTASKTELAMKEGRFAALKLPDARFAVLGVGNSQWPNYQAFPKRIDSALEAAGAIRLLPRYEADGQRDFDGAVTAFSKALWSVLGSDGEAAAGEAGLTLQVAGSGSVRAATLPGNARRLTVAENREMVHPAEGLWDFAIEAPRSSTRLVRLALPPELAYRTGDHVAIYASNRPDLVGRALARLGLDGGDNIHLDGKAARFRHLPLGQAVTARQLLTEFVDLQGPASRRVLPAMTENTNCPRSREAIAQLDADWDAVAAKRLSLLELLEGVPAAELPLKAFVELSPAISPRFYSAASSDAVSPRTVSLIVGTSAGPAWSGLGPHQGFASSHMRGLEPGAAVFGYIRTPNPPFQLPADPQTDVILIGAGTGLAPFRGFLEERAARLASGAATGRSLLFFGCRHPDHDWLCREELAAWAKDGVVSLFLAFSAAPDHPARYVQDALRAQGRQVSEAISNGAAVYLCGDGRLMAPAVRDALIAIRLDEAGGDHESGSQWLQQMIESGRFHQDVFW